MLKLKNFGKVSQNTSAISDFKQALSEVWEAVKKVFSALSGGDTASFGEKIGKALSVASKAIQAFAKIVQSLSPEQIRAIATAFIGFKVAQRSTKIIGKCFNRLEQRSRRNQGGFWRFSKLCKSCKDFKWYR